MTFLPSTLMQLPETIRTLRNGLNNVTDFGSRIFSTPTSSDDTLGQSAYNFSYQTFPQDLGQEFHGHYMVININVPVDTSGVRRGAFSGGDYGKIMPNELSKVDTLRFGTGPNVNANPGATQREFWALNRYTRRIEESIALFMPNQLVFSSQNAYEDISLSAIAGSVGVGALNRIANILPGAAGQMVGVISSLAGTVGTVSRMAGHPINPRVEILFATTPQRQFVFEVLMAPRNSYESEAIKKIVRTLRFHAAPELSGPGGLTFIPPAEFDITFFNKGVENVNIPRINTCVLNRIEVDYSPSGVYSTFNNGHPVAVRLSMSFTEVELLHKLRIAQGF